MRASLIGVAVALIVLSGCGGGASATKQKATTSENASLNSRAAALLDQVLHAEDARCVPLGSGRLSCELPSSWARVTPELVAAGPDYAIKGCEHPSRRCVFDPAADHRRLQAETQAEARTAMRLAQISRLTRVVCSRKKPKRFDCGGYFHEPQIDASLKVDLTVDRQGFYSLKNCRITSLGRGSGGLYACQHLIWDVGHMESTAEALSSEADQNR